MSFGTTSVNKLFGPLAAFSTFNDNHVTYSHICIGTLEDLVGDDQTISNYFLLFVHYLHLRWMYVLIFSILECKITLFSEECCSLPEGYGLVF